jgi:hypothetical protein
MLKTLRTVTPASVIVGFFRHRWQRAPPAMGAAGSRSDACELRGTRTRRFAFVKAHLSHCCLSHSIPAPLTLVRAAPAAGRRTSGYHNIPRGAADLGQPERHVAALAHDFGADLDQLLPPAGQRPRFRSGQPHMGDVEKDRRSWPLRARFGHALATKVRADRHPP